MNRARSITLLLALAFLGGCATSGPAFSPISAIPEDKALVYIYRPSSFVGGGVSYTVKVGDSPIVKLKNGGYFPILLPPGETEFWAKTEARGSATENLKAGEVYYLKGGVGVGLLVGRPKLQFAGSSTGADEVRSCKLLKGASAVAAAPE